MTNIKEALEYIFPSALSYDEWLSVGMALKYEGFDCDVWDNWSKNDTRYRDGECQKKWESFNGSTSPVTGATILQMARSNGYKPMKESRELSWNDNISFDGEQKERKSSVNQIITYLEALFSKDDIVGYVTASFEKDGKYMPTRGFYDRTAGQLIEELYKCGGDIGAVFGDYNEKAGAWIRFNPLDGKGIKNENVTDFRYALIECDNLPIETQKQKITDLQLPVAALVYSGGKSIHAIVKVEAKDYSEYRKRVEYIYKICQKNGLSIDTANRNPSRLSRMPGVKRGDSEQTLLDVNIGFSSFLEWEDYIESTNDDFPDEENLKSVWDKLPELSPPLIENILRQGHKMLIAGPSKAGKSFSLIELAIAIAEGENWLGFKCTQGRVLYVNLELDRASCLHRFKDVYTALNIEPKSIDNIDIWNLRGKSVPMNKLTPKLITRSRQKKYIAVIIDPIYKVITGDENSADQMATFCNEFDKICTELKCATIYCHHHSKGTQTGKRSMDRASGSGVFARDPDALIDMIEIPLNENIIHQVINNESCNICVKWLKRFNCIDEVSPDDLCNFEDLRAECMRLLKKQSYDLMMLEIQKASRKAQKRTAWTVDGILREFPKFDKKNIWFDYPIHRIDDTEILNDLTEEDSTNKNSPYKKNFANKKSPEDRAVERKQSLEIAFEACSNNGKATLKDLSEQLGISERSVRNRIKEHGEYLINNYEVFLKS